MASLGVHFALSDHDLAVLQSTPETDRPELIANEIEEKYFSEFPEFKAESDKAWDAIHRILSDGELSWDGGTYPLNHTILGGQLLYSEDDYIISLKDAQQVRDIAQALSKLDEDFFRKRYFSDRKESLEYQRNEQDFQYTWEWFQEVRRLFAKASDEGRSVIFAVDQ